MFTVETTNIKLQALFADLSAICSELGAFSNGVKIVEHDNTFHVMEDTTSTGEESFFLPLACLPSLDAFIIQANSENQLSIGRSVHGSTSSSQILEIMLNIYNESGKLEHHLNLPSEHVLRYGDLFGLFSKKFSNLRAPSTTQEHRVHAFMKSRSLQPIGFESGLLMPFLDCMNHSCSAPAFKCVRHEGRAIALLSERFIEGGECVVNYSVSDLAARYFNYGFIDHTHLAKFPNGIKLSIDGITPPDDVVKQISVNIEFYNNIRREIDQVNRGHEDVFVELSEVVSLQLQILRNNLENVDASAILHSRGLMWSSR